MTTDDRTLAAAVAAEMHTSLLPTKEGEWARIRIDDHRAISCVMCDGRFVLSASRPPREPDGWWFEPRTAVFPSITVDPHRDPKVIAREVDRRLLPGYALVWDEYRQAVSDHRRYMWSVATLADRVRDALGDRWDRRDVRRHSGGMEAPVVNLTFTNHLYGEVRISHDGATFDLRVTGHELTVALALFLGALRATPEA